MPSTIELLYHLTASFSSTPKSFSCWTRYFSFFLFFIPLEIFSAFCFINLLPVVNDASCTAFVHWVNKLTLKNPCCIVLAILPCNPSPAKPSSLSCTDCSKANPVWYSSPHASSSISLIPLTLLRKTPRWNPLILLSITLLPSLTKETAMSFITCGESDRPALLKSKKGSVILERVAKGKWAICCVSLPQSAAPLAHAFFFKIDCESVSIPVTRLCIFSRLSRTPLTSSSPIPLSISSFLIGRIVFV